MNTFVLVPNNVDLAIMYTGYTAQIPGCIVVTQHPEVFDPTRVGRIYRPQELRYVYPDMIKSNLCKIIQEDPRLNGPYVAGRITIFEAISLTLGVPWRKPIAHSSKAVQPGTAFVDSNLPPDIAEKAARKFKLIRGGAKFQELVDAIATSSRVFCTDSLVMHIAVALDKPTTVFWTRTNPSSHGYEGTRDVLIAECSTPKCMRPQFGDLGWACPHGYICEKFSLNLGDLDA